MIFITWCIPALLFFVSIFGWEHFIGFRDLGPGECMVQFLRDPAFNTSLIIGYYWIPLTILFGLYSFIFHAAWTLSKRSADKEKERQKLLANLSSKPRDTTSGSSPATKVIMASTRDKKATNTALGIAAVAVTSSLAPSADQKGPSSQKVVKLTESVPPREECITLVQVEKGPDCQGPQQPPKALLTTAVINAPFVEASAPRSETGQKDIGEHNQLSKYAL